MYEASSRGRYRPRALNALAAQRAQNETCLLLTLSSNDLSELVADELKLDGVLCNQIESKAGVHTGLVAGTICFGPGKRVHALAECERRGVEAKDRYKVPGTKWLAPFPGHLFRGTFSGRPAASARVVARCAERNASLGKQRWSDARAPGPHDKKARRCDRMIPADES
jgi:haloacid dehalogenase-like hydrolase